MRRKILRSLIPTTTATIAACLLVSILASKASAQPILVNDTAGPRPAWVFPTGYLKVYSATYENLNGDNTFVYPHTDYRIFTPDGRYVMSVSNAITPVDEIPSEVRLPVGHYIIRAKSETMGTVDVPVVVRTARVTKIHLERCKDWCDPAIGEYPHLLVRLPNGQPIAWKAYPR